MLFTVLVAIVLWFRSCSDSSGDFGGDVGGDVGGEVGGDGVEQKSTR